VWPSHAGAQQQGAVCTSLAAVGWLGTALSAPPQPNLKPQTHALLPLCPAGPPRGQLKAIDHNCNDIPDAAMTAAVAALLADGQTAIRDVYNWRVKETERMKVGGWREA
jgi:hypothetical protein